MGRGRRAIRFGALALLLAAAAVAAPSAVAHEGGTIGLDVAADRVPPGADLPLVGEDWAPGEALVIRLVTDIAEARDLGVIRTGPDGHFLAAIRLPPDTPLGPASIDAISESGVIERDNFLVDAGAPPPSLAAVTVPADADAGEWDPIPILALGLSVAALVVLATRTRRHPRRPTPIGR